MLTPRPPPCSLSEKNLEYGIYLRKESLREKCPYLEFFWSVFSRIQCECGKIRTRKTPNTDSFYAGNGSHYDLRTVFLAKCYSDLNIKRKYRALLEISNGPLQLRS